MADEKTEQAPVDETPYWATTADGRVFVEGVDVTDMVNPGYKPPAEQEPPKANADNAELEGEEVEAKPEPEPEKKEEPPKEEEQTPEPEPEPEKPKEPEKLKFRLKFRGKEEDVEYTPDQIQVRLNKLRAFEENEKELWDTKKKLEPYKPFLENGWIDQKVREAYETGELERPPEPPAIPTIVQYEIAKRQADPDHDEILSALREYAMRLPANAAMLLDTDPTVFLPEYDRVAAEIRAKRETPQPKAEPPKVAPEEVKKKLELKEVAKKAAAVSQPGVQTDPVTPIKAWEKRERELMKALRDPANASRSLELAAEILLHRENKPSG